MPGVSDARTFGRLAKVARKESVLVKEVTGAARG